MNGEFRIRLNNQTLFIDTFQGCILSVKDGDNDLGFLSEKDFSIARNKIEDMFEKECAARQPSKPLKPICNSGLWGALGTRQIFNYCILVEKEERLIKKSLEN